MITTHTQYHAVASRMEQLKDAAPGSQPAKELKVLTRLIVEFESSGRQQAWSNAPMQRKRI